MKLNCGCGYSWEYGGKMTLYASCPNCRKAVKINAEPQPERRVRPDNQNSGDKK